MKRTLRTSKPMPNMEEMKKAAEQVDPSMLGNVQNVVDKYGNKSEAELMQELSAAKQSGLIDPAALASASESNTSAMTTEPNREVATTSPTRSEVEG